MPLFTLADAFILPPGVSAQGLPVLTQWWSRGEPVPATNERDQLHFMHTITGRGCDLHGGRIGSKTPLYIEVRTGSMGDHMVGLNIHANWDPGHPISIVMPLALDINNDNRDVAWNEWPPIMGLNVVSGGKFHPRSAFRVGAETVSCDNRWRIGYEVDEGAYDTIGIKIGDAIVTRPAAAIYRQKTPSGDGLVIHRATDEVVDGVQGGWGAMVRYTNAASDEEFFAIYSSGVISAHGRMYLNDQSVATEDRVEALERRVAALEAKLERNR